MLPHIEREVREFFLPEILFQKIMQLQCSSTDLAFSFLRKWHNHRLNMC